MGYNFYNLKLKKLATGSTELVINGGFEGYSGGVIPDWTFYAEAGSGVNINGPGLPAYLHSGSYSISPSNLSSGNCYAYQVIAVTPGSSYNLSFWTMGDGSVSGRYSIYDLTNSADIIAITSNGVTAFSYTEVTNTVLIPAGCLSISLRLWAPATAGEATYDDVSLLSPATGSVQTLLYTPINLHLNKVKKSGQGQPFNVTLKSSIAVPEYLLTEAYVIIETESEGIERE